MSATAEVRYSGNVAIIDLAGRVCLSDGLEVMRGAIKRELESGHKYLLLNLAGVTYMDSAGLGEMASAYIAATGLGGRVILAHARDKVQAMLRLTRLHTLLLSYAGEAEALASFGVKLGGAVSRAPSGRDPGRESG